MEKIALQDDIALAVEKEKKLKQELTEARLAQSSTINNTMDKVFAGARGDGSFGGYMNRHRNAQWISGKVQMNSAFLSGMKTIDKDKNTQKKRMTTNFGSGPIVGNQAKVGGKSFITRKSVLGLSNQQMNMVKSSGAVEEIDERDLIGSDSGSQDGE